MGRRSIYGVYGAYTYQDEEFVCEVDLPETWFEGPVDGLLGVRLMLAGLLVLRDVGRELEIGMPKLRKPNVGVFSKMEVPFTKVPWKDPAERPECQGILREYNKLPRGDFLLIGRADAETRLRALQERVASASAFSSPKRGTLTGSSVAPCGSMAAPSTCRRKTAALVILAALSRAARPFLSTRSASPLLGTSTESVTLAQSVPAAYPSVPDV
jgi:hypothetical protein